MRKFLLSVVVAFGLSGCGYNTFQTTDEQIKASWAEVLNQYQRRADLVPNLVNTVKGAAAYEQDTLVAVTNARARATAINATPALVNDPTAFAKFEAAQGELSSALSRLLVVVEKYPTSRPTAAIAIFRPNWRAPKTALPWHAIVTSSQCKTTTSPYARFRAT